MGSDTIPGIIFMIPHSYGTFRELEDNAAKGINETSIQMMPSSEISVINRRSVAVEYSGIFDNVTAKGFAVGILAPNGGGMSVICLTEKGKYSDIHKQSALSLADSFNFFTPVIDKELVDWISAFYYSYIGSTERKLTLCPDGRFSMMQERSLSGTLSDQYGDQTGSWGGAGNSGDSGRWTIKGDRKQGIIYMRFYDGKYAEVSYRVGGRGAFYFNGVKYGYAGPPKCN